ncbi:MAG: LysR family transcriptional regulator [Paracoccaceae bacterium]|nr:LysR family transcriptional regulator [Paracoccaceae bacterium]MDG2257387.1 LysR family transcriptional regulator [Paracoccaceae bacterium]
MRKNLNLNWLRSFEAAARLLSFTAAGREIGLTQTAVSQHIKALETQLGDTLFLRRPKSLHLTDVGKAYLQTVREALDTIEMSTNGLFGPRQTSTITIRASMAFIMWLSPRLDMFLQDHPDIGIKLVTSIWRNAAENHPVDVDIILAPKENPKSNFELLSDEAIVPIVGSASGTKKLSPKDLPLQPPIYVMGFDDHWARYLAAYHIEPTDTVGRLITDTSTAAIEMVAAGLGCAVVIEKFAHQAILSGQQIQIVGDPVELGQSHYLARMEKRTAVRSNVEAFENWLRLQF